jgi:ATP-dependent helicase/nuclease subunit B
MLRFCFGASGAGKSTGLYREIIKRSIEEPGTDFLIIVPDQFTMQTQKDVVRLHPKRAIMNIDVLSFGRLSHRVFEETGHGSFSVLDDVGKSLVLRHVSDMLGDELPIIGRNMHKPGYLDEVKSTISEFMMYGIEDKDLCLLEEKSSKKGALRAKLGDLRLLYGKFLEYIEGKFITTEETLDILCKALPKSVLIRDSVIVFDGFTGFTPIQYRVIKELLSLCREVVFSVTISPHEDPYADAFQEQELFMLSKKTVRDLEKLEFEVQKENGSNVPDFETYRKLRHSEMAGKGDLGDVFYTEEPVARLKDNEPLAFLEKALFRYTPEKFTGDNNSIFIYRTTTPAEEIRQTMIKIANLVRDEGYAYRDIALVCGSLDTYGDMITRAANKFGIPVYVDQNVSLMLNPFIEYITSALNIVISGYRYEDVFHYMRSGMTGFDPGDTDLLENYVRALGISGRKQWEDRFLRRMPRKFTSRKQEIEEKEQQLLEKLDAMRAQISSDLKPLFDTKGGSVKEITDALICVIEAANSKEKLEAYTQMFESKGDLKKAREYDQIYTRVMELLNQMNGLIGDEKLDMAEYRDVLSAGFGEISVGTIPQDVDRIIVGDIERTRLKEVRVLFFVGVNDGNIPSSAGSGGILSDIDRQFLQDLGTDIEFAPSPRQQMYIQRLYLYMNLTKPTDKLFLSYAELGNDGKSLRCAYLIPKLRQMFEGLEVERPMESGFEPQMVSLEDGMEAYSDLVREYAGGRLSEQEETEMFTLKKVLAESDDNELVKRLTEAAFVHYESVPIAKAVALALYGATLENSVSRLEQYASCAYAHFIKYGLSLNEREEYNFDASDLGNVFHQVLEKYTGEIITKGIDWRDLSKEKSDEILNRALTECADAYGDTILRSSAQNQHMIERIKRILTRTVDTLKYQISSSSFNPAYVEMSFQEAGNLDEINVALSEDEKKNITEKMKLKGKIDRVDLCSEEDRIYVKVMDFKSSEHRFNLAYLYYGLQLQLVMYMNVAVACEKKKHSDKEIIPAAILYYHVEDPMIEGNADTVTDDINKEIISQLKMTGLVNENMDVIRKLDAGFSGRSDIIPVEIKKDGTPSARSQTAKPEEYEAISSFVNKKVREFGRNILNGDISVNPYEDGKMNACTYCDYKHICGFDERIRGYKKRKLDISADEAKMRIMNGN